MSHTEHTYEVAFEIATKFSSEITFLKCIIKPPPKFGFFETKGEKKEHEKKLNEAKESLTHLEDLGKKLNVSVKSTIASIESLTDYLISYIEKNIVDLVIIDSHSLDEAEHIDHKAKINSIFKKISCPILTLK